MLTFAICDDEPLMAQEIKRHLSTYMKETRITDYRISNFSNGRSLLESGAGFNIIFLDIQMEPPNGLETAKMLRQRGNRSLLVFVTVLEECVFDAFEVEAYDYLIKPLDSRRFNRTMDRTLKALEQRDRKRILVQRGTSCDVVLLDDIVYCEVQGRKIYIHKSGGDVIDYYGRLEDLEHRVGSHLFKCHRSYLVNLDCVRGCQAGQVMLPQGETIPVSRLRERDLTQALLRYMKERDF